MFCKLKICHPLIRGRAEIIKKIKKLWRVVIAYTPQPGS